MDFEDFQKPGCASRILRLPEGSSKNYTQRGDVVTPYGWLYASRAAGSGGELSSMISSSADIMNSTMKATGFHIKETAGFKIPGIVDLSAEVSMSQNKSNTDKNQNIQYGESTYSEHKFVETQYAFVLDKHNVAHSTDFEKAVSMLQKTLQKSPDGNIPDAIMSDFFEVWGTHYAYSGTYGAKGHAVNRYSKNEIGALIDKKVSLKKSWSGGVNARIGSGGGGGATGGKDYEGNKEQYQNFTSVKTGGFESFKCVGGLSCDGQHASAGTWVPVYLDLRPLSDLLGPPFYKDEFTAITLRNQVEQAIIKYAFLPPNVGYDSVFTELTFNNLQVSPDEWRAQPNRGPEELQAAKDYPTDANILNRNLWDAAIMIDKKMLISSSGTTGDKCLPAVNPVDPRDATNAVRPGFKEALDVPAVDLGSDWKRSGGSPDVPLCVNRDGGSSIIVWNQFGRNVNPYGRFIWQGSASNGPLSCGMWIGHNSNTASLPGNSSQKSKATLPGVVFNDLLSGVGESANMRWMTLYQCNPPVKLGIDVYARRIDLRTLLDLSP